MNANNPTRAGMQALDSAADMKLTPSIAGELRAHEVDTYDERYASQGKRDLVEWLEKHPRGGTLSSLSASGRAYLVSALKNSADIAKDNRRSAMAKSMEALAAALAG